MDAGGRAKQEQRSGVPRGENKQYVIQISFYLLIYKKTLKKKRII